MPMDPATLTPIMTGALLANGLLGPSSPQLAAGLASGLSIYAQTAILVQTTDVGTLGAGKGTGIGVIVPPAITASMLGSFSAAGMLGPMTPPLATAVATAFTLAFAQAGVNTVSAGVGVGAGKVTLIPSPGASVGIFMAGFTSAGMVGVNVAQLAAAVANGLDMTLPSCTGVVVIVGPPSILPGAGLGIGKLI